MHSKITTIFIALATFLLIESASAQQVSLGQFDGEFNNTVTSGVTVRASARNCKLISGRNMSGPSPYDAVGNPARGNGGCASQYTDNSGNVGSSSSIVGENGDDANLNFDQGDVVDATSTISSSLSLSGPGGVGINLSGIVSYNPVLDINSPSFKKLTDKAADDLESKVILNNAYATFGAESGDTFFDFTAGSYVESLGTTALLPIGVNVANAIDLSVLRAPGASIKDALIPQEMLGVSMGLSNGISINAYTQFQQREVILDPAGSFYGSEVVGVGSTGILKSPHYMEAAAAVGSGLHYGNAFYDFSTTDCDLVDGDGNASTAARYGAHAVGGGNLFTYLANFTCTAEADGTARTMAVIGTNDTETQLNTWIGTTALARLQLLANSSTLGTTLKTEVATTEAGAIFVTKALEMVPGGIYYKGDATGAGNTNPNILGNNSCKSLGCTDADIISGWTTFGTGAPAVTGRRALLSQQRAADKKARDDGQFGLNVTGYTDVGAGIDWGIYYSNYHSKAPYVQMLPIRGFNAVDLYGAMIDTGSYDILDSASEAAADQINANFKYGAEALGYQVLGGVTGCTAAETCDTYHGFMDTAGKNDAGKVAALYALSGKDTAMSSASILAMAALQPADRALYQVYYPEDIEVFGVSASTVLGNGFAVAGEVAFRPDFPLQLSVGDQFSNMFDSTGGTALQTFQVYLGTLAAINQATSAAYAGASAVEWSGITNCNITSSGTASSVAGYNECVGHTKHDALSVDLNVVKTFSASSPYTTAMGADYASLLFEVGSVYVGDIDNSKGVISAGHFQIGNGFCDGIAGQSTLYGNFALYKNGLLGDKYCDGDAGADSFSATYRLRTAFTYNNFNNTPWQLTTSAGLDHDFMGNAPSSLGGFIEGRMKMNLGLQASKNDWSMSLNYTDQMGDIKANTAADKDTLSYSVSYAF